MPPGSCQRKRNRKRPRTDSDPHDVLSSTSEVHQATSPQRDEVAPSSQSSQPSFLRRSQRIRRCTGPNPDTGNGETSVANASQISQPSAVIAGPASQMSRLAIGTRSSMLPSSSTSSKPRKKQKRSQKVAVRDRTAGVAESATDNTLVQDLVSSTPHSTSTSSPPNPILALSHVAELSPAVAFATNTPSNAVLDSPHRAAATETTALIDQMAASTLPTLDGAREHAGHQPDHTGLVPLIQLSTTESRVASGRDFGSGNVCQNGPGNVAVVNAQDVHIHNAPQVDEHQDPMSYIREKLGAYLASEATLRKDIHGDPSLCHKGTREKLLEHILLWVGSNDVASRALCIVGAPGSGKSTIMNTLIVKLLDEAIDYNPGLVLAHYCIRRNLHSTTDATKVFPTIILQLCHQQKEVAKRVFQLLAAKQRPGVLHQDLLERLFIEAVKAHSNTVFVVIDALDEAFKPAILADMLSRVIPSSPSNLRLLLATRNEHGVLQGLGQDLISNIVHEIPTEESLDEVGAYIVDRLRDGVRKIFEDDLAWRLWPDDSQIRSLSKKAGGLFIWARTAVDFILSRVEKQGDVQRDWLIEDIGRNGMADVNALYMLILQRSLPEDVVDDNTDRVIERIKGVLGLITVAEHPLPLDDIVGFLGYKDYDVRNFARLARSILVPGVEKITGATAPQVHKTFSDFLISVRAEKFQLKLEDIHRSMASRCFELMDSQLRFNICGLRSSFLPTKALDELVASIPKGLIYASTSWWYHLTSAQEDSGSQLLLPSYLPFIRTFLCEKLLFWFEIIGLSKEETADSLGPWIWLRQLARELENSGFVTDASEVGLSTYARDAASVIVNFIDCIRASIPHIYISLLAFSPEDSVVANHYRKRTATTVIPCPQWVSWKADPRKVAGSLVLSVSFSPCGHRLAVGYHWGGVWVWDVETGGCRIGPLQGLSRGVRSACFSPNGLLIASVSEDSHDQAVLFGTPRQASAYLARSQVIEVKSSIAFGSADTKLWKTQAGESCICRTLSGHQANSLSFHPDGHRLVSGSSDTTLRIWDMQKGACTHEPLTGHTDSVRSVCFSPDGRYIASGSNDRTIRIWDANTAVCVAGPFGSTRFGAECLAFSPDGKYLAEGSGGIVRLWDFNAVMSTGLCDPARLDEAPSTRVPVEITDHTVVDANGFALGPKGELLFCAREPALPRPSTLRILGRSTLSKPDLSNLITGEEWLQCFPTS